MKDDYSNLDWSKAVKNPFAGKLKKNGKYTATIHKKDGTKEKYFFDAVTLEKTKANEVMETVTI